MPRPRLSLAWILLLLAALAACGPRPVTPVPDNISTSVAALAITFLTRTAAAASPTPTITLTPPPTETSTPNFTPTPAHERPLTKSFIACFYGPGPSYTLESNIKQGTRVELLGVGSQAGWYIIRNPYFHKPCWVQAAELEIDPGLNLAALPVMTPGPP